MSAKQKLDKMKLTVTVGVGVGAKTYDFFFIGQKESYTELGLSASECGIEEPSSAELQANMPIVSVSNLIKSGKATRLKASGINSTTGRKVSRSILAATDKITLALAAVNDGTKPVIDGADMTLSQPTRRRLV